MSKDSDQPFGAFDELPNWVWDVIFALEKHEEEHPSMLPSPVLDTDGTQHYVDVRKACCIKHILDTIPMDVRRVADHVKRYKANA